MQIQNNNYNPNFGMALKYSPVAKKFINKISSRYVLDQLKVLEKEQKKNPFDVVVIYQDALRQNGQTSFDFGLRAKVGSKVIRLQDKEIVLNFITKAIDHANELNAKFTKVGKK